MDSKKTSKDKITSSDQSTIKFPKYKETVAIKEKSHPPYDAQTQVENIFQVSMTLLELTHLGKVRLHRSAQDPAKRTTHQHMFTWNEGAQEMARNNFRKHFNESRELAVSSEIATVESWAAHTTELMASLTAKMRTQPMVVIDENNL